MIDQRLDKERIKHTPAPTTKLTLAVGAGKFDLNRSGNGGYPKEK